MISIPITLEQLITAVQQLQPEDREKVAKALIQADLRSDLTALIQQLYAEPSVDDITDDEIIAEIKAVRQQHHLKSKHLQEKLEISVLSESSLQKDWLKLEEDEAWQDL